MTQQIRITPQQMHDRSKEVHMKRDQYTDLIAQMDRIIAVLQTEWEGKASDSFRDQFNSLQPSFESMKNLLDALGNQLRETGDALLDIDQAIASKFTVS